MENTLNKHPDRAAIVFAIIAAIWVIISLTGCTTQRKAAKYFDNHGFEGAAYCATRYPVDSFYSPGKTTYEIDTFFLPADLKPIQKILPNFGKSETDHFGDPNKMVIRIKQKKVDTVGMVSRSKYKSLQGELSAKQKEINDLKVKVNTLSADLEKAQKGRRGWRWTAIGLGTVLLAFGGGWIIGKSKLL